MKNEGLVKKSSIVNESPLFRKTRNLGDTTPFREPKPRVTVDVVQEDQPLPTVLSPIAEAETQSLLKLDDQGAALTETRQDDLQATNLAPAQPPQQCEPFASPSNSQQAIAILRRANVPSEVIAEVYDVLEKNAQQSGSS